jgi:hypothetical protein
MHNSEEFHIMIVSDSHLLCFDRGLYDILELGVRVIVG